MTAPCAHSWQIVMRPKGGFFFRCGRCYRTSSKEPEKSGNRKCPDCGRVWQSAPVVNPNVRCEICLDTALRKLAAALTLNATRGW